MQGEHENDILFLSDVGRIDVLRDKTHLKYLNIGLRCFYGANDFGI